MTSPDSPDAENSHEPSRRADSSPEPKKEMFIRSFSKAAMERRSPPPRSPDSESLQASRPDRHHDLPDDDPFLDDPGSEEGSAEFDSSFIPPQGASTRASASPSFRSRLARWFVRLAFIAALIGIYSMIYDQVRNYQPGKDRADSGTTTIQVPQRNYKIQAPSREWSRVTDTPKGKDVLLARANPAAKLWTQSGVLGASNMPIALLEAMREDWSRDMEDFEEKTRDRTIAAGQSARRLVADGVVEGQRIHRVGTVFSHGQFWYRIVYEAPIDAFEAVATEAEFALSGFHLLNEVSTGSEDQSTHQVFDGIAFDYRLYTPRNAWEAVPELDADSRFADLKLATPDRLVHLVVSPRPGATTDQLLTLYKKRQDKLFEGRVTFNPAVEDLVINTRPAKRIGAVVADPDGRQTFLISTFLEGEGIVYQIEARGPEDRAVQVLPLLEDIVSTFEAGSAIPKSSSAEQDSREENHFRPAPPEFNSP